jgi:hypothetical protein
MFKELVVVSTNRRITTEGSKLQKHTPKSQNPNNNATESTADRQTDAKTSCHQRGSSFLFFSHHTPDFELKCRIKQQHLIVSF